VRERVRVVRVRESVCESVVLKKSARVRRVGVAAGSEISQVLKRVRLRVVASGRVLLAMRVRLMRERARRMLIAQVRV
jgi:hypothetical protein